jgi:DMSO/TMAO reductase YedYZ molybdopterin-dependent catalytic subunit
MLWGPTISCVTKMNGAPLQPELGFPQRLIVPGWYGVANIKWLMRIEVRPTRLENRFMWRDYVTIREEKHDGNIEWVETSVGRAQIKSTPARVVREDGRYKIVGMAWGAPIARVEVSIDSGPWQMATIDPTHEEKYAWRLWSLDWPAPVPGYETGHTRSSHVVLAVALATKVRRKPRLQPENRGNGG